MEPVGGIVDNANAEPSPPPDLALVSAVAAALYAPELPYHNFDHARRALVAANEILAARASPTG